MTEAQARGDLRLPAAERAPAEVDFPSTFTNDFLPKK